MCCRLQEPFLFSLLPISRNLPVGSQASASPIFLPLHCRVLEGCWSCQSSRKVTMLSSSLGLFPPKSQIIASPDLGHQRAQVLMLVFRFEASPCRSTSLPQPLAAVPPRTETESTWHCHEHR